ncbi:glycosyltransferase family protein [Salegentibacter echinorum]|uniref:hypothetical protein n=1 Tax=Salegentibacter echinorum TaxID=1073325 RepID=UPI0009347D8D|nr:hypothetical protein [Salegentibacter echinorum]
MKSSSLKKILVVAESIDVEDSSASKGRVALIKNLAKAGFQLQVYHYTRKNIQLENIPCYAIKENRRSFLFILSRLERQIRYKLKIHLNKPLEKIFGFSFTLFNDRNSIVSSLKEIQIKEYDLVLTLSKGGSFRPHHALLKMPAEWHKKWMAYIHDPYPFSCYPRPYDWVEPGHAKKRNFFIEISKNATFMAYPSLLLARWMESYYPGSKDKRVIIPHQIQTDYSVGKLPAFFDKTKFNIVHAGFLMGARNPTGLLKAFKLFLEKNPEARENVRLIMIDGPSIYSNNFQKMMFQVPQFYATEKKLTFDCVYAVQQNASVNVILEAKAPISPFLPGKFPHCIASEKPILLLGPNISESHRLLGKDYPYWAEIDDVEAIYQHIGTLYKERNSDKSDNSKHDCLREYLSPKYLKKTFQEIRT